MDQSGTTEADGAKKNIRGLPRRFRGMPETAAGADTSALRDAVLRMVPAR
jgi:hypothetical protein